MQIKKRKHWPSHYQSDVMLEHFYYKKVGYSNAIQVELDGVTFYSHGMKELYYVTCHFATYVTLERMGENKQECVHRMERLLFNILKLFIIIFIIENHLIIIIEVGFFLHT